MGEVCFQCENLSIRKQGEGEYQCKNKKSKTFTVMLNLFHHLTSLQQLFQTCEILNLSWIIRVLAGVTSRSNLRARLRRRPTENLQVQGDIKNKTVTNYLSLQLLN